jgi:ABC-type sulfate transport system permease subunit
LFLSQARRRYLKNLIQSAKRENTAISSSSSQSPCIEKVHRFCSVIEHLWRWTITFNGLSANTSQLGEAAMRYYISSHTGIRSHALPLKVQTSESESSSIAVAKFTWRTESVLLCLTSILTNLLLPVALLQKECQSRCRNI